jgi:hypothetical protein
MSWLVDRRWKKLAVTAVLLAIAASAYAYWTSSGTGTGSAGTGTTTGITVNQTSTVTGLYPGGPAQALSGNFTNTNAGAVVVASVNATISSVTKAVGAPAGACTAADYTLSGFPTTTVTPTAGIPSGTGVGTWSGGTIAMVNSAGNQDGCKGATVNISYTSN